MRYVFVSRRRRDIGGGAVMLGGAQRSLLLRSRATHPPRGFLSWGSGRRGIPASNFLSQLLGSCPATLLPRGRRASPHPSYANYGEIHLCFLLREFFSTCQAQPRHIFSFHLGRLAQPCPLSWGRSSLAGVFYTHFLSVSASPGWGTLTLWAKRTGVGAGMSGFPVPAALPPVQ